MSTNILIGVGGTGAKVVEAALHVTAAGLGPSRLLVGFVDQDQANGNVARAKQLLISLRDARAAWRTTGARHRLGVDSGLLSATIEALAPDAEVWIPHTDQGITLSGIFERDRMSVEDKHLLGILFAEGDLEQDMPLGEGYRGRPHLGSAAMAAAVDNDEFWRQLIVRVKQAGGGDEVRLLLTGSVFGGTGAAGFPTLARLIRRKLEAAGITRNIRLGGALMLPYFGFQAPDDEKGSAGNVARTEQLLMQSREALRYYHNLFAQEKVFDELYFVGWEPYFQFKYHSPGSNEQANPALLPELIAALGVCRFFNPDRDIESEVANPVLVSARRNAATIDWADLPSPQSADAPYQKLGQMLRFATAWKHWGEAIGAGRSKLEQMVKNDPWYKAQGLAEKGVDFKNHPPQEGIERLTDYLDRLVVWAASIQHYCKEAKLNCALWMTDGLVSNIQDNPPNDRLITLRPDLPENLYGPVFNKIVVKKAAADHPPDANSLTVRLNTQPFGRGDHAGVGRMVGALHAYSALTD